MSEVLPPPDTFDLETEVLVIGGGACGLTAALAASDAGAEVIVLERDASPSGSTAMSSGFVPAPGTRVQRAAGIEDSPERFAADIAAKAKGLNDPDTTALVAREIGPALDWLEAAHGLEWEVLDGFLYPGHSRHRMHAVPERTGAGLMARLLAAVDTPVVTGAHVTALYADGPVRGVRIARPDGAVEHIGAQALVLACNGYGGNRELVAEHIPAMAPATYHGHPGNRGDAVLWGQALGAEMKHLSGCQGHGSLAHPHGVLITWAVIMEGGIQVNARGERFWDESVGYSEAALAVLAQPGGVAWDVFDARILEMARGFPDFREAEALGAVMLADTAEALAARIGVPVEALARELGGGPCRFGRGNIPPLGPPYAAVKVTGALFHTQGGLAVDEQARVRRADGGVILNLFAGGGAACSVSGPELSGYLSGNGLLTAIALGAVAGREAAATARHEASRG